jgi:hypothetical protein
MTLEEVQRENLMAQTAWLQADTRYRTALAARRERLNKEEEIAGMTNMTLDIAIPGLLPVSKAKKPKKEGCDLF